MHFPALPTTPRLRFALLALLSLVWLLIGSSLQATPDLNSLETPRAGLELPELFGEIVYQTKTAAVSNIYIIANGHRSAISGANSAETLQAQIETFQIGEWLINQRRIDLLLPEGFFGTMAATTANALNKGQLDNQSLQNALTDTSQFVNAELLLHENYGIGLGQIEDRKLYRHTRERLRASLQSETWLPSVNNSELAYLQRLRTATILQAAPLAIETAYRQGRISAPNAMLTIGLSHLDDIIAFLKAGKINLTSPHTDTPDLPVPASELELLRKQVNVTVIVPRILISKHLQNR